MQIKEEYFIMTQVQDGSPMFDLEMLCKVIKKKTKAPELHMKNCGYGLPFEECIKRISMNRVSLKHEDSISFDDALKFLKEEFNYINQRIMALINIFSNWQKAKDYDKLEEINDKLCIELYDLKKDIRDVEDYAIGLMKDAPKVNHRFDEIIDVISDYRIRVADLYMQINRLKSQLQKRDTKTGRFVKK